jgi:hypothetical protein
MLGIVAENAARTCDEFTIKRNRLRAKIDESRSKHEDVDSAILKEYHDADDNVADWTAITTFAWTEKNTLRDLLLEEDAIEIERMFREQEEAHMNGESSQEKEEPKA